jgi:hypothetical protein
MRYMTVAVLVGVSLVQLPPSSMVATATSLAASSCVPKEGANSCANLLPIGFAEYSTTDQLKTLRELIDSITLSTLVAKAPRRSSFKCKLPWQDRRLEVRYAAPAAMALFPVNGTEERELVTGVFQVEADEGCWESKYGVKIDRNKDWKRVLQFMAVRTEPKAAEPEKSIRIGAWRTFAIYERSVDGVVELSMSELDSGRYVNCAHASSEKPETVFVAFTGCRGGAKFHMIAEQKSFRGISRVDELVGLFNAGDKEIRSLINANTFTDPIWGYCGGLGCCASE